MSVCSTSGKRKAPQIRRRWRLIPFPTRERDARLGSGLPGARGLESGLYGLSLSESQAGYPIGVME